MGSDIGLQLVAVVVALAVPAYLSLGLRCYVRSTHEVWGLDDLCMLFAAVPFTGYIVCDVMLVLSGVGKPEAELILGDNISVRKWSFLSQLLWCWCLILIKSSIAFALCRATLSCRYVYGLYVAVAIFTLPLLASFVSLLMYCHPIDSVWNGSDPSGHCSSARSAELMKVTTYASGACNVATDILCTLLPIPILLWGEVRLRMKLAISFLIALGMIASVSSVVHLTILILDPIRLNPTTPTVSTAIFAYLEPALGLIAGCLSTLRPIIPYLHNLGRTATPSQENLTGGAWHTNSRRAYIRQRTDYELGGDGLHIGITETYIRRSSGAAELQLAGEKGEKGLQRGISVTRRFEVS